MEDLQVLSHLGGLAPPPLTLRHSPADSRAQLQMKTDGSGQEHSLETLIAVRVTTADTQGPAGMLTERQREAQPGHRRESKHALAKSIRLIG